MQVLVRCPAKINRFLSVGPPDNSGYHPIRTIFQAISIFDELVIESASEHSIESNWTELPADNTLTKTIRLVKELVDVPPLRIVLRKEIPSESGLGGASTDAAGLLRALEKFIPNIPWDFLPTVAAAVGADVPFFLVGGLAQGEGYGERLTPLPDRPTEWLVVVRPNVGVATVQGYRDLDARPRVWNEFPADFEQYNDFERVAPCESLDIIEYLKNRGSMNAGLTGSGSAVFGFLESEAKASEIARSLENQFPFVRVAHTLSRQESLWIS